MNTVIVTTLARLPPARLSTWSICENTCFTCASKLLAMSAPWLSRVAVWPATQTILPPSLTTPGENARDSWNGVFSMYSAAPAASGSDSRTASGAFRIIAASFMASPKRLSEISCFVLGQQLLEALVGSQPYRRDQHVQCAGDPLLHEGERNRGDVDGHGDLSL